MKYYNLHIDFNPSWNTYNEISRILNVEPKKWHKSRFDKSNDPSGWHYQLTESEEDSTVDFINIFLDLIEPNFSSLAQLGIERSSILFWLNYEYQHQCALSFFPQEMERLGKSGISLNIDCFEINNIKT